MIGKLFSEVLPELANQNVFDQLETVFITGIPFHAKNQRVDLLINGKLQPYYFNYSFTPLYSQDEIYGVMNTAADVTDLKNSQQELEEKNWLLKRINNDLDNFIYTASHDLKASMSNIEGILHALRNSLDLEKTALNEDTEILLQMMDKSINRFKSTILDLTEISKSQKEDNEDIQELILEQIIEDVKLSIHDKIIESNARIEIDFSEVDTLKFSRKNTKSIIYNLLSNDIKYRDENREPVVSFKTEKTEKYIVLSVKDNGLGISEGNIDKVFTMFKRFHDHVEGTGIGMYIVKRIIDNAGGKIEIESKVGEGSVFKVYFAR